MSTPALSSQVAGPSLLDSRAVPWLLVAVGVLSYLGSGDLTAALHALRLPDTDDAMRLAEVRDLVGGQSWFDMVQHRFLPPAGVASHWSRLVDAPLAAAIAGLTPLVGTSLAERIATAFWPPLLFLAYALVLVRGLRTLANGRAAILAIFAATQTIVLRLQFAPGRIDHHNLQIVFLLGAGLCLMQPLRTWRTGTLAGLCCAGSMAVGLEAMPLIALAGAIVAVDWMRAGRPALPALLGFGLSLGFGATLLFGLQTSPALWATDACDALSPPWLWLAGTGSALALGALVLQPKAPRSRAALAIAIGALGAAGFAALFPSCLHGPFTGMPDAVRTNWLDKVREMQPMAAMLRDHPAEGLGFAASLVVATLVAIILAFREKTDRRPFVVASLFLAIGAIQTCFQLRGLYVASAFVPVIAGICLDRALTVCGRPTEGTGTRVALLVAVIALNAQVWLLGGRLVEQMANVRKDDAAAANQTEACSEPPAFRALAGLTTGTVLAPIDLGPYLLVHTSHAIVAAPYHRAAAGLIAGLAVAGGSEDEIHRQATATGATYLALCPDKDQTGFAARLARGEAAADWLDPIPLDGSALKAWRIR
ncbi:hypothetical protein [Methylobacterium haplocladii]|uniref:Glycosyltransferase RgtA/B/C/D-like domain-containing protein n=1 Tax=Methylobacterium haplocladii TaxID=1176176 RepID=A0A512IKI0_9HYPH|nr:hypothetical protein [Methylobacterium haplocladii]GEO98230.1 hypothetical protein MHA02_06180 [Methylobacterium haplocladii]GJD84375.1 hypothetical protein HPGCJGGD_2251 [Methylobacterium haplocladii]GLS59986.1 hypothetical protein GCM10007887_26620 [Methylobacterium haplocladii]